MKKKIKITAEALYEMEFDNVEDISIELRAYDMKKDLCVDEVIDCDKFSIEIVKTEPISTETIISKLLGALSNEVGDYENVDPDTAEALELGRKHYNELKQHEKTKKL